MEDTLYYPEARLADWYITARQFVDFVWNSRKNDERLWDTLASCFTRGELLPGTDAAYFETDHKWRCDVRKRQGAWKLEMFLQNPD